LAEALRTVLFLHSSGPQGPGEGSDPFVGRMRQELGSEYEVRFPIMPGTEIDPHYEPWRDRLVEELGRAGESVVILGHSLGGSVALKYAAEQELVGRVTGLVIVAAPFWGQSEGEREWALPEDWTAEEAQLPPTHLFHSSDDEVSPFSSLDLYAARLPEATVHPLEGYGHLYERGDLSAIVSAVKAP
jgi:predicted alpha/beta hydrolase family esterase